MTLAALQAAAERASADRRDAFSRYVAAVEVEKLAYDELQDRLHSLAQLVERSAVSL